VPIVHPPATGAQLPAPTNTWITVAEAAMHARVSERTIRAAVIAGTLRHARVNRRRSLRFLPAWVDSWLMAENTPIEITRETLCVARRAERA
jgi:excisionase family DNA binding protein